MDWQWISQMTCAGGIGAVFGACVSLVVYGMLWSNAKREQQAREAIEYEKRQAKREGLK